MRSETLTRRTTFLGRRILDPLNPPFPTGYGYTGTVPVRVSPALPAAAGTGGATLEQGFVFLVGFHDSVVFVFQL